MKIRDEELDYKHHLAFDKNLGLLTGDPIQDAYWYRQAERMHSLHVSDAVRDVLQDAVIFAQKADNPEADFHLRFGVASRAYFIWVALRKLLDLIPPDREEPLPLDFVHEAAMDLNVIYINIRGTLDNFAWCLLYLFGTKDTQRLPPAAVDLFGKNFLKDPNFAEVATYLKKFEAWNKELRGRRDPAAHRIPLSVPRAVLDNTAQEEYARVSTEHDEAYNAAFDPLGGAANRTEHLERTDLLNRELERIGRFEPVFVHHPDEGCMKIYPTVPQDIGQLVRITRGLSDIILGKLKT